MKPILLVIDMQNNYNINYNTQLAINNLKDLLDYKPDGFEKRIFTRHIGPLKNPYSYSEADWSKTDIVEELKPYIDETIRKQTYSAITPEFCRLFDWQALDKVYIAGFDTDSSVLATAFALFDKGAQPFIIQNCCATSGDAYSHKHTLEIMRKQFNRQSVITSGDVKQILKET